jgi:hypothetical protein
MEENNKLAEELNKILFLAGVENILLEAKTYPKEPDMEIGDENEEESDKISAEDEKESQVAKIKIPDYLNTKEEDYLSLPMKYAMLSTNADAYLKDMEYFYLSLKNKKVSIQRIIQLLSPEKEYSFSPEKYKTLQKSTQEFLKSLENNYEKGGEGEEDKILKVNTGDETSQYQDLNLKQKILKQKGITTDTIFEKDKEQLKKSFHAASGDQKAIVSYGFNRETNELKLTPLGFWQLQFLSRIFKQQPKSQDDLEAIFFHSNAFGAYYNKAERILSDFYMHAIYPMAIALTGRSYNINPNDHEFQIMLQNSWDKIKDNIDKYDASRENFGAWAFTVARNALIDQIKKITDYDFQDTAEARDFVINQNLIYLHFNKDMSKKIPEEFLEQLNPEDKQDALELVRQKENFTYLYKFKTANDLFDFLQENQKNQSVFKSLSSISRRILNNLKVLHSKKKFADVWSQGTGEETYDMYQEKAKGEERDKNLIELYNLYKKNTDMSIDKKSFQETKNYESTLNEDGERIYPDDELEMAFRRDIGMALFYYQTEFIKNFPHLDTKIPGKVIDAVLTKYVNTLPDITDVQKIYKTDAYHYINKTLREKNKGDVVANPILFKNRSIKNPIIEEIDPYIRYDYKVARAMKKEDVIPALREEFIKRQENRKRKEDEIAKSKNMYPKPVYTFRDRVDEMFAQIGKGISGLINIKREKGDANIIKKIELLDRFSTALTRLTGFSIQLEESKNDSIDEINNYLLEIKQNIIKKTLI